MWALALIAVTWLTTIRAAGQAPPSPSQSPFEAITAGRGFTCELRADQTAFCWGDDTYGQLGAGTAARVCGRGGDAPGECSRTPIAVAGEHRFTAISAGYAHVCAIDTAGDVFCWGENQFSQLGVPDTGEVCGRGDRSHSCSRAPVHVAMAAPAVSIGAGEHITCAVDAEGAAWCWGMIREPGPTRVPLDVPLTTVAVGGRDVCGLASDAGLHCWRWTEVLTAGATSPSATQDWTSVTVGNSHACALDRDGRASCWGSDADAALGIGPGDHAKYDQHPPGPVAGDHRFRSVVTSTTRTCGIDQDGALYCWGRVREADGDDECLDSNGVAETNDCVTRPVHVQRTTRFRLVAVGDAHQCGLTLDGGLLCWGTNDAGQIGNGQLQATNTATPVRIGGVSTAEMRRFDAAARVRALLPSAAFGVLAFAGLGVGAIRLRRWWRAGPPSAPPQFTSWMGPASVGLVVSGWMVGAGMVVYVSNPPTGGGDVGLGLAWLVIFAMAGMALTLSAAATILATVTLRNDRRATAARVALILGALTLLAGTIGVVSLYLDVVRI